MGCGLLCYHSWGHELEILCCHGWCYDPWLLSWPFVLPWLGTWPFLLPWLRSWPFVLPWLVSWAPVAMVGAMTFYVAMARMRSWPFVLPWLGSWPFVWLWLGSDLCITMDILCWYLGLWSWPFVLTWIGSWPYVTIYRVMTFTLKTQTFSCPELTLIYKYLQKSFCLSIKIIIDTCSL